MTKIVIVGAGQASSSCAAKLRNSGFEGSLTIIGKEPVIPYQRPPLSKKYMLGDMELDRLFLRPEAFYSEHSIDLRLGQTVEAINREAKTISIGDTELSYDQLVLTTGSWPRRLPSKIGGDLQGVYVMRDLADADTMAKEFVAGKKVLIIGGGYIGLEAAAVASAKGLDVTLVEMADRILQRVAAPQTSDYFRALHKSHGVKIIEGVGLSTLTGNDGKVSKATLSDGTELDVDFVIAGVGVVPADELAQQAGLDIENGIKVNSFGQTSDPSIWSAGDCASFPYEDSRIRLESVGNAIDQAEIIAENLIGADRPYAAKPWFWSDQFDVKLQIAGLNMGYDDVIVRHGDTENSQSHWYYMGDRLIAVDAMNESRSYMIGKRLIEAGKSPDKATIQDPTTDMKALLKA